MRTLITAVAIIYTGVVNASAGEAASPLPSEQQVLTFIGDTIDWYRQLPTSQRIGTEAPDLFFLENNRPTAMEIVRLSFQFGRAVAAIESRQSAPSEPQSGAGTPVDKELAYLLSVKSKLGVSAQRSDDELKSLTQARLTTRGADRKKLDPQIAEMRTRIQVLSTISAHYENVADFIRSASVDSNPDDNLAALVEDLERTVPEVSAGATAQTPSNIPANPSAPYGIMGGISQVSAFSRKQHYIETAIERTNALIVASQNLRGPFREAFLKQVATLSGDEQNLEVLQKQQSVLAGLVGQLHTVSPALGALIKQDTLLNLYRSRLGEWHSDVRMEYRAAWKALLIRLGILAASIFTLFAVSLVVRRVISAHGRDHETRQAILLGERVLFLVVVIAVVLFAFAFDPRSLATFLGLLSAGLAVGFHDVLLAIGGRILLARRFHLRLGQQIEIAGVKGELTKLGLMEFALKETNADGGATGREVFFANSYVFVSPATPLFRQISAPALRGSNQ